MDTDTRNLSLIEWASIVHELAIAKGWYDDVERSDRRFLLAGDMYLSMIANVHCEISEATEEVVRVPVERLCEVRFSASGKPEGFLVELADAAIRSLDMIAAIGEPGVLQTVFGGLAEAPLPIAIRLHKPPTSFAINIATRGIMATTAKMHSTLAIASSLGGTPFPMGIAMLVSDIVAMVHAMNAGDAFIEAMQMKHAFNQTRSVRHGKLA